MICSAKQWFTALLVLALVGAPGGNGWAGIVLPVHIDDLTDTPTVTLVPPPNPPPNLPTPTILPDSTGEFLHFTLPVSPIQIDIITWADFFETQIPLGLSDRVLISQLKGSNVVDVKFASDPAFISPPENAVLFGNIIENGDFQFVGARDQYDFFVRSDPASSERGDVPDPTPPRRRIGRLVLADRPAAAPGRSSLAGPALVGPEYSFARRPATCAP